jgi:hypothetical protein
VAADFVYRSDSTADWMTVEALREWIARHREAIGHF